MRVVAVAGAKGGVGKTAAAVNLAMLSAEAGHRTLLWDLDPQGAATHCYRARARVKGGATRLLGGKRDLERVRPPTPTTSDLDLLAGRPVVPGRRHDPVAPVAGPTGCCASSLRPLDGNYDVVILDCAPGLGVVTESVDRRVGPAARADHPRAAGGAQPRPARGVHATRTAPGMPLLAFLSMLDERKVLHRQVRRPGPRDRRPVLARRRATSSSVERMGMEQIPAVLASPNNLAAVAYRRLWAEVEDRLDLEPRLRDDKNSAGETRRPQALVSAAGGLLRDASAFAPAPPRASSR